MAEPRERIFAELSLVGIAAVWGLTFPLVQDAVARVPVMAFLGYRFLAAAAIVAPVWGRDAFRLPRAGLVSGLWMGVFLTGGYVFQTFGLERTSASNAGFITGLFVVLTPVFGWLFFRHRISAPAWVAAMVSVGGLLLLSAFPGTSESGQEVSTAGDALVFLCACSFSLHILVTEPAVKRHSVGGLLVLQLLFLGVFCTAAAALTGDLVVPRAAEVWVALVVTAVLASALGFFVQAWAQKHSPAARVALILASEPAFAGLFAYLLKGEVLSGLGWAGAGLILAAIVTVEALPHLRPARPLPEG